MIQAVISRIFEKQEMVSNCMQKWGQTKFCFDRDGNECVEKWQIAGLKFLVGKKGWNHLHKGNNYSQPGEQKVHAQ